MNRGVKWPARQNPQETSRLWRGEQAQGWQGRSEAGVIRQGVRGIRACSYDCMHWAAARGAEGAQTAPQVGQRELSPLAKIL